MKERDVEKWGEYRTRRLVLDAFDRLSESRRFRGEMEKRRSVFGSATEQISTTATRS
jgi:hypothetical protein